MYKFSRRESVNAERLKETRECIRRFSLVDEPKELRQLQALEAFALDHVTKAKAFKKLKAAIMECAMADAEMYQIDDWRRATEREVRAMRERQEAEATDEGRRLCSRPLRTLRRFPTSVPKGGWPISHVIRNGHSPRQQASIGFLRGRRHGRTREVRHAQRRWADD
jgi:hypothetical protein